MPTYELCLILRSLPKLELKATVKRAGEAILMQGGLIRDIQYLGTRQLPCRMRKNSQWFREGSYFLYHLDSRSELIDDFAEQYRRDIDIIKARFSRLEEPQPVECTLEDELLPPAYRPEVHKLIETGSKKEPKKFDFHVDYYPF